MTKIEWTDRTWNPIVGCSKASAGCDNCYALTMAHRLAGNPKTPHYNGLTQRKNSKTLWTGKVRIAPNHVWRKPLLWKKPQKFFVNSMGDLFHPNVLSELIDRIFAIIALCPQHTFQILTKRPDIMRKYIAGSPIANVDRAECVEELMNILMPVDGGHDKPAWPLPNLWLGTTVENQEQANKRIPLLLNTPAAIRFVSCEPLLGKVDLIGADHGVFMKSGHRPGLDQVICGGETGPNARPMHPGWVRSLRDQCQAANVPFFFKGWGEWAPSLPPHYPKEKKLVVADYSMGRWFSVNATAKEMSDEYIPDVYCVGKASAGCLLDCREWNEFPKADVI